MPGAAGAAVCVEGLSVATEGDADSGEEDLGSYMDVVANLREQQDAVRACWPAQQRACVYACTGVCKYRRQLMTPLE